VGAGLGGGVGGLDEDLLGGLVEVDEDVDELGGIGSDVAGDVVTNLGVA
jgi:hypothetical protein